MSFVVRTTDRSDSTGDATEKLRTTVCRELKTIVGESWVEHDPAVMDSYAWQYAAEAAVGSHYMPRALAVVLPSCTAEVAEIVRLCTRLGVQYKALSTGFGFWNSPATPDRVIQIDLRRLDQIHKIDRDNMIAVIDPYVTGNQLQTEAMKVGLNTHIAGCGGEGSVLASATSMMGQGWDGVSMGFSNRNLLGFEWVMPDGEIVQVGSFDASGEYFLGDGPGFSVRGIIRGFAGALGGLGVFTRAAVKLYPWEGPPKLEQVGASPDYCVTIPEHHFAGALAVNDWRGMAELGYRLGEAGIVDYLGRNAPALMAGTLGLDNNEVAETYEIPLIHHMQYALVCIMTAKHADEAAYKRRVVGKILRDLRGGSLSNDLSLSGLFQLIRFAGTFRRRVGWMALLRSLPGMLGMLVRAARRHGWARASVFLPQLVYQALLRSGMNVRGSFRFAGSFWTAMGSLVTWDNAILGAKVGEQVKQKYIKQGAILDDGGDNAWGGLYEGGAYAHLEELAMYDQTDPKCKQGVVDYILETNLACIENRCGDSLNAVGPTSHVLFSPVCMNYDRYTQRIKAEFDPKCVAESSVYTDAKFVPSPEMEASMKRVSSQRAAIDCDTSHIPR